MTEKDSLSLLQRPTAQSHTTNTLNNLSRALRVFTLDKLMRDLKFINLVVGTITRRDQTTRGLELQHPAPDVPPDRDGVEYVAVLLHAEEAAHGSERVGDLSRAGGRVVAVAVVADGCEAAQVVPEGLFVLFFRWQVGLRRRGESGRVEELAREEVL